MQDDVVIRCEGLGKSYVIGHTVSRRERYVALRDVLAGSARSIARSAADLLRGRPIVAGDAREEFWALQDVSFEVRRGEVVGIIGRNGAGKSTLLKILSRITEPSRGRVTIKGRVASLLEVGTGFHPELTGRENIFLNGAILGMTKAEIRRKFDAIVAFAEVERFLDTPVKRYSSGMYVRLAFAVAAHLEPEILVVDEVLAVGDAEFQKKCLGKLQDVAGHGRTVLFVSHNMNAVARLCRRVMCLERGQVSGIYAEPRDGILAYLKTGDAADGVTVWRARGDERNNDYFMPQELRVASTDPRAPVDGPFSNDHDITITIVGEILRPDPILNIGLAIYSEDNTLLFWTFTSDRSEANWLHLDKGPVQLRNTIPRRFLNEGTYRVELLSGLHHRAWLLAPGQDGPVISFAIRGGLSDSPFWDHKRPGLIGPVLQWDLRPAR